MGLSFESVAELIKKVIKNITQNLQQRQTENFILECCVIHEVSDIQLLLRGSFIYSVNVTDFHDKLVEHNSMDDVVKAFVNHRRSCHARTTMVVATVTCNNV